MFLLKDGPEWHYLTASADHFTLRVWTPAWWWAVECMNGIEFHGHPFQVSPQKAGFKKLLDIEEDEGWTVLRCRIVNARNRSLEYTKLRSASLAAILGRLAGWEEGGPDATRPQLMSIPFMITDEPNHYGASFSASVSLEGALRLEERWNSLKSGGDARGYVFLKEASNLMHQVARKLQLYRRHREAQAILTPGGGPSFLNDGISCACLNPDDYSRHWREDGMGYELMYHNISSVVYQFPLLAGVAWVWNWLRDEQEPLNQ